MQIINFPQNGFSVIGASGICPHCSDKSYFKPVTGGYSEDRPAKGEVVLCAGAQCEACKEFVLVIGFRGRSTQGPLSLRAVFPLGKPNDMIEEGIPTEIGADFREALRCRWVGAFKATVTMCRRAIQASCLDKKAGPKKKLTEQIDEIGESGLITEPLRLFAHEVRLEGNDGAHPGPDGLNSVTEEDADDILEFTREYLHHVYVMPEMLARRKERESPSTTATAGT